MWIDPKKCLPNDGETVLVLVSNTIGRYYDICRYADCNDFRFNGAYGIYHEPIAWKPIEEFKGW